MRKRRQLTGAVLAVVALAGCSSGGNDDDARTAGTLFRGGTTTPGGIGVSGAAGDTTLPPVTLADGTPVTGTSGTGGKPGTVATGGSAGTVAAGGSGFPTSGQTGPGFTATEINIGFQNSEGLQEAFKLIGASGTPGDDRQISEAMVAWLNKNGGIAGRKVVPIHHQTPSTSGTWASQAQAACATFGEDNKVVVAVSGFVGGSDAMSGCMAAKKIAYVESNIWGFSAADFSRLRDIMYQPGRMNADRWSRIYVDGLQSAGFFERNSKLGLLRVDAPTYTHLADDVVKPRLTQIGVKLEKEVVVLTPQGIDDFGRLGAAISNAILQFRQAGVTHLMFLEPAGTLPFFFMPAAESQGYRPRYGPSAADIPDTQAAQVPAEQLHPAPLAVGWMPASDVGNSRHPGGNAIWDQCTKILGDAGIPREVSGIYTVGRCDALLFWKTVLERASSWTLAGFAHRSKHSARPTSRATRSRPRSVQGVTTAPRATALPRSTTGSSGSSTPARHVPLRSTTMTAPTVEEFRAKVRAWFADHARPRPATDALGHR